MLPVGHRRSKKAVVLYTATCRCSGAAERILDDDRDDNHEIVFDARHRMVEGPNQFDLEVASAGVGDRDADDDLTTSHAFQFIVSRSVRGIQPPT